ncbi:MAG: cytochrome C peroxidase [Undibacterium sp.]|nr:cytochrome C peroxidase [Opitutaceae bacterium]
MSAVVLFLLWARLGAAELTLECQLRWRGAPLTVPSVELAGAEGRVLRVTRFAALVSGVELRRADGGAVQLDGQYGFIDAETGRLAMTLRNVPEDNYTGLEFQIGVPPAINHADPGQCVARHPLNPIVNGLHWGWSGGYVFAAIEGRWRAAGHDADERKAERGFSYHLATDARLMRVRFAAAVEIAGPTTVRLTLDLGKVLGAQKIAADGGSETTHSGKDDLLAVVLAKATERAWFFLEAVPMVGALAEPERRVRDNAPYLGIGTPLAFAVPTGFPQPELPADNPLTVEGVELGRRLFGDRRLSARDTQSCATCHRQELAFSEARALSIGADGTQGTRNSMPLFNLAWSPSYAWDGAKPQLRDQAIAALTGELEMHADPAKVAATLGRDPGVRQDFAAAFGTPEVTVERIGLALEQFMLTLVSADSKFDRALRGAVELSDEEKKGFELFASEYDPARSRRGADCFHCHGGALFTDYGFRDNGLGLTRGEEARSGVTGRATDAGKFKTPSLRNVAVTAPYMHDGRLGTLEEVVAHYDHGVSRTATLDPNLAKHPDAGLQLTMEEQRSLVAFLRTLTDTKLERAGETLASGGL